MSKIREKNCKIVGNTFISVKERIAKYDSTVKKIQSSSDKTKQYLESTGIYTKTGRLTKNYR